MILHEYLRTFNLDSYGLHAIENFRDDVHAVSLHCYIPPIKQCWTFDEDTGEKTSGAMTFDSQPE